MFKHCSCIERLCKHMIDTYLKGSVYPTQPHPHPTCICNAITELKYQISDGLRGTSSDHACHTLCVPWFGKKFEVTIILETWTFSCVCWTYEKLLTLFIMVNSFIIETEKARYDNVCYWICIQVIACTLCRMIMLLFSFRLRME